MPRRVEDMRQGDRRSIRDISLEHGAGGRAADSASKLTDKAKERAIPIRRVHITPPTIPTAPQRPRKKKRGKSLFIVAGAVVVVAVAAYASSSFFARATFIVTPVEIPLSVNTTMVATGTTTPGYMTYKMISASASDSATVPAVSGPSVSVKATGKVTLYNAYSTATQRLIAGTRLGNDTGLVYRLAGSVVVPGYTVSNGVKLPGSVSADIVADQPGQSYDISGSDAVSDLRVIAWKGTARYDGFYGRLASDIVGGWLGPKETVDPSVLASTTASLESAIASKLVPELGAQVPDGYILYPGAEMQSYSGPVVSGVATSTATVTESGILYAALFKESDLVNKLSGTSTAASFQPYAYTTPGLDSLSFTITNPSDFSPAKSNILIAKMTGNMKLVGTVPVDKLKAKLAGLSLGETAAILRSYSPVIDVEQSSGELFPAWISSVPSDVGRISVVLKGQ